jgi:hypothetical protein
MDVVDQLNRISQKFAAIAGRPPRNWGELVAAEGMPGPPFDATGVPYALDPRTGRIDVSPRSVLWPLPWPRPDGPIAP